MCSVWISEQAGTFSVYNFNRLDFITDLESVYCAVRNEFLCNADTFRLWNVNICSLHFIHIIILLLDVLTCCRSPNVWYVLSAEFRGYTFRPLSRHIQDFKIHEIKIMRWYICYIISYKRLRWSRGSVLAFSTQVRGFKPGRSRRIFRAKKSSARLPSEGK